MQQTAQSEKVGPMPRRGDLVAYQHTMSWVGLTVPSGRVTTWEIGIVASVSRDGTVKKIDMGVAGIMRNAPVGYVVVSAQALDMAKVRAHINSTDNYPWKSGTEPLRTFDDVLSLIEPWRV